MSRLRNLLGIAAVVALLIGSMGVGPVSATDDFEWTVPMTADAGDEGDAELAFGIHPDATDGYDSGIDVPGTPPGPVPPLFEVYFSIVDPMFSEMHQDFRGEVPNEWTLVVKSTSEPTDLSWDAAGVPAHLSAIMKYGTQRIDMKTRDNMELPAGTHVITISVSDFSVSDCKADPNPTEVGYATTFSVDVSGGVEPYTYLWEFGDGETSEEATPTHTYDTADTYIVKVTVQDDWESQHTCEFELVVNPPLPVFEWIVPMTADAGPEGSNVELAFGIHPDATDGYDSGIDVPAPPSGPVTPPFDAHFTIVHLLFPSLNHDFRGDTPNEWTLAVRSTNEPIDVSWDAAGVPAHLSAIMKYGTQNIDMKTRDSVELPAGTYVITITVSDFSVSDCQAHPNPTKVGYATTFGVDVSGGVEPYSYLWDFGDGETSEEATPHHAYDTADTYTVKVTVQDDEGSEQTCEFELVVNPPLSVSDCQADPDPTKVDYETSFSVTVSGGFGGYTYLWEFADGETSTDAAPTHSYDGPGTYTVKVTVQDERGNLEECEFQLVVNPPLSVSGCQADPDPAWVGHETTFSVSVSGGVGPYTYAWDFGDDSEISTEESPTHTYTAPDTYTVTVTVTDALDDEADCSFALEVGEAVIEITLKAGWNLVSLPVVPADPSVGTVFAGADVVHTWDPITRIYYTPTEVEPNTGYWVAVEHDTLISIHGVPVYDWTASIRDGWNLIGSVLCTVDFTAPDSDPAGKVEGFTYRWDADVGTYVFSTTIEPGMGQWAAATGDCQLTLSCTVFVAEED